MAKNVLFLIHGVGQHSAEWATSLDGPATALLEASKRYEYFAKRPLQDCVELVPLRYDHIFDKILKNWGEPARELQKIAGSALPLIEGPLGVLAKADDGNPAMSLGGDVVLYKSFVLFRQAVQLHVLAPMVEKIAERTSTASGTPVSFHILAHSLGTTVAHDVVHALGSESWPEDGGHSAAETQALRAARSAFDRANGDGAFRNGRFRFGSLFQVSNTSGLLHTTGMKPTESICRPGEYVQNFFNVDHKFDPISKIRPFLVPNAWGPAGRALSVDHIHEPNIHGFAHYLQNPLVHVSIFKQLIPDFALTDAEKAQARLFPMIGPKLASEAASRLQTGFGRLLKTVEAALEDEVKELQRWVGVYRDFAALAEELRQS